MQSQKALKIDVFNYPAIVWRPLRITLYCRKLVSWGCIFVADSMGLSSGGSRIWQGLVSNPSERGTGGGELSPRHARAGVLGTFPRKFENLDTLIHFPDISGHYKLYDWAWFYDRSGVDFAGDTISIVHRDRKGEVAQNWATVYFQKGHPKQRADVRTPPGSAPIFIQMFVVGSERRTCFETQCVMALQRHPRSLILAPFESAYGTSYLSWLVTLVLFYPVSEIWEERSDPYSTRMWGFHLD